MKEQGDEELLRVSGGVLSLCNSRVGVRASGTLAFWGLHAAAMSLVQGRPQPA